jgi:shikimate kinase
MPLMTRDAIILIGMPGCGKSTLGVLLAKRLARPFVDTDLLIQAGAARPLQQIIDQGGLDAFRALERQCLLQLDPGPAVVATGGSAVYYPDAMAHLAARGTIVYLRVGLPALRERLSDLSDRGLVIEPGLSFEKLYHQRLELYESYAQITVDCDGISHAQAVRRITAAVADNPGDKESTR